VRRAVRAGARLSAADYDTVGKLDLKLRLGLDDAGIDQAGQTGGELVIPGIHGYGTPG
jgi:hypothetical protein